MPGGAHHQRGDRMILGLYVSAREEAGTDCRCFELQLARAQPCSRVVIRNWLRQMNHLVVA